MAVKEFRNGGFDGVIGISNNCDWREPLTDSEADRTAAQRALEFFYGWFTDPIFHGDYPKVMRERLGKRLPDFTDEERALVKGSTDFLGLNHYSTAFVSAAPVPGGLDNIAGNGGLSDDQNVYLSHQPDWEKTDLQWSVVPWGFRKMLNWIAKRYPGLPIYVTENGCAVAEPDVAAAENDEFRCRFINDYVAAMQEAIADGSDVRGYFVWSLIDNFEWALGFSKRLGLIRCDYNTLERTPKKSYYQYRDIIKSSRPED